MAQNASLPGSTIPRTDALAASVAVLPPPSPNAPLATTAADVDGFAVKTSSDLADGEKSLSSETPIAPVLAKDGRVGPPLAGSIDSGVAQLPAHAPLSTARLIVVAAIVTCTMCLGAAGAMGLIIALPAIQVDLNMREVDLQWVSSVYSLTAGCFLLLAGRIADVHGRKIVFVTGVATIAVFTLIGGFMNNGAGLVVTRALAGCGSAMSTPSAIGIIASHFKGRARSSAFAAFSAGAPVGAAVGLVVGGLLTAYSPHTWRAVLWTLASLSFFITGLGFFFIPADPIQTVDKRIDWLGAALVTVGLIFVMFVISDGSTAPQGWKTWYIILMLVLGVLFVAGFFFWENYIISKTTRPPLMRLKLWTRSKGRLAAVYFIGFVSWMGFSALFYHATLFYQQVQQTGPMGAMLRFIPCSVSGVLCNVLVAWLVNKVRTQWIICTGILSTAIASILFAVSPKDVEYWRLPFNGMWMAVLGADFLMATGSIFVAALALPEEQSVAGAVFQTLIQLGGSFGIAITTVISTAYTSRALENGFDPIDAQVEGLHAAFWLGAGCSVVALGIACVMLRGMGTIGKGRKDESAGKAPKENDRSQESEEDRKLDVVSDSKV